MKRILLLAYYFPPIGGAGVQRNAKLARYLPELGYELTVVTGPGSLDDRWTPTDPSMTLDIDPTVEVHRIATPEPSRRLGRRVRMEQWLRLETPWQRWWEGHAVPLATAVGTKNSVDLVYCSLAPFTTARAAATVARALGKPLVYDLEDPWAIDEMMTFETALHARLERRAMRRALGAADAIVMNTPESGRRLCATFPELARKPVTSIVNGYDAADFEDAPPPRDDGAFRIVHTGSLHQWAARRSRLRRMLGGGIPGVNVVTRSLIYLRRALDELLDERPELRSRVELHMAGRLTEADRAVMAGSPVLREHGFLPHNETTALMRSADLLFLPMHDLPAGRRVAIVPCKTYEYLGSRRPILAAVPDGDARDFLVEAANAFLARPDDVAALKQGLIQALERFERGEDSPEPDPYLLARIERRTLTRDLAAFFDELTPLAAAEPAAVPAPA
jgi:glycosyltransferase involved in cell wall biosynthesis